MGHSIPVIYLVCDAMEVPSRLATWHDAQELLSKAWGDKDNYFLHTATGRNWWHVRAVTEIRDRDNLGGLDFVGQEIAVVPNAMLLVSIEAIRKVIDAWRDSGKIGDIPVHSPRDVECDIEGGFEAYLSSLIAVLKTALAKGKVALFVQPQP